MAVLEKQGYGSSSRLQGIFRLGLSDVGFRAWGLGSRI